MFQDAVDRKLIKLVRDSPVLYNAANSKYVDFNLREVAWQKIGDELRRPAADCKRRWVHIRDVYRRILRNRIKNPGQDLIMKPYKYDKEMSFLKPFYKDLQVDDIAFVEQNDDEENCYDGQQFKEEETNDIDINESDESEKPAKRVKKRKRLHAKAKRLKTAKRAIEIETEPENKESDDLAPTQLDPKNPVDAFLLSIGATLKTFSPYHLNLAKSQIFSVVQQHEMDQIVHEPSIETEVSTSKEEDSYITC